MERTNKYITSTRIAQQLKLDVQLKSIVQWLAANRNVIASPESLVSIFSTRSLQSSPMSELFSKCVVGRYLNEFSTIADPSPSITSTLPEAMTMSSIVIDLAQAENGYTLSSFKDLYRKIIMNITHLIKRNKSTGQFETSALHELHSMYVKGLLVRSYFDSGRYAWLSPIMQAYIARTYSLFIATTIARQVNLNYAELNDVASIFALYMYQMLAGTDGNIDCPSGYANINYLGTRADLIYTADKCKEYTKKTGILDLETCCKILSDTGPARLKNYSLALFFRQCTVLGSYNDTVSTMIAFDYPPYWVWLLLLTISGVQMRAMNSQMQTYRLKEAGMKFALDLMSYQGLIEN